ncbi:armadillo-type protein [Mycotypha africana]|uniref:armadillo-type protein n=1 Tax=Mycotypha africana TaxID=64632 RepID=UPI0023009EC8|nr:armadillo-type protein [Mycotypha africana]KAI8975058.1 armadillo-type protein [Mycotypha africana]
MSNAKSQLLQVLIEIVSQDQHRIKQAEALLKQWENSPNFFITLQDIFCDRSMDEAVRMLCGIYLKNGIDRFWRRSAKNPISPEEKNMIRERLLQSVDEPSKKARYSFVCFVSKKKKKKKKKLTAQNAAIIAKIARLDYPQTWPELFPTLIQSIQTVDFHQQDYARLVHYRILEIWNEVLLELASRRLVLGRQQFADIVPTMFQTVAQVYVAYVDPAAAGTEQALVVELEIVSLCLQCLKTLLSRGVKDIQSYEEPKVRERETTPSP